MTVPARLRLALALLLVTALAAACASDEPDVAEEATEAEAAAEPDETTEEPAASEATEEETEEETEDAADAPAGGGEAQLVQELADRVPAEIREAGVMTWVGLDSPPTRIPQDDGSYEGIEVDLADAVSTILDIEIEFVDAGGLGDILLALESGRNDFFVGPLKSTAERQETFDFIVYALVEASFLYSADVEVAPQSEEDLCGLTISIVGAGVLNDFTHALSDECEAAGNPAIEVLEFADREGGILAVDSGQADAHGTTSLTAAYYQTLQPDAYGVFSAPIGDEPDPAAAVVSNTRPELGELMFDTFTEMHEQGVYQRIAEDWTLGDSAVDEILWNYAYD